MVNSDILNVSNPVQFDEAITSSQYHTYLPYASTGYGTDDEIRIPIQNREALTLPSESYLIIEGNFDKPVVNPPVAFPATTKLSYNGLAHLFSEIRYELNGVVIDQTKNPGVTTSLKGYISYDTDEQKIKTTEYMDANTGQFQIVVPLNHLFGFCEDYRKILLNIRQELVLIRANVNTNAYESAANDHTLEITKISWRMPHIMVSDSERLRLLKILNSDPWLAMGFMTWELHELPQVNRTTKHTWTVRTSPKLETPRYIIFAFQNNRKNTLGQTASEFDNCNLTTAKLYLNGIPFPYDNIHVDFPKNHYPILYNMYARFQSSYYGTEDRPLISYADFKTKCPMVVFDCSRQPETLKSGSVDIRIEWETAEAMQDNTSAYCLILHDRVVNYRPLSNAVQVQ